MNRTFAILAIALAAWPAFAQAQRQEYAIKKLTADLIPTPRYTFQGTDHRVGRPEDWLEIEVQFESAPEWTDELTFRYFIFIANKCLTGEVTHVDIPRGRDLHSVMFVSPRSLARLMEGRSMTAQNVENVGVQIMNKGQVVAVSSIKEVRGNPQWWQNLQQTPGMVINKNDTPFAPLYWDRYEAIKAGSR